GQRRYILGENRFKKIIRGQHMKDRQSMFCPDPLHALEQGKGAPFCGPRMIFLKRFSPRM
ncbi:MAG: hypothetical protein AAFR21_00365, partial [Pseudomonadota bacterium]